jgi:outer membrane protein TolC
MMRFNLVIINILLLAASVSAQNPVLKKREAVELALEYNYDIKVANNNAVAAFNNASIYNSGYLPTLTANAGANYNVTSTNATFADGSERSANGIETNALNAGLGLNYTLFDGNGRKYNYEILKENYNLSELQARQVVESTLLNLFSVYYEIARLTQNQLNLVQSLDVSRGRLLRAKYGYEYGQNTRLEVLNAEVNFNTDSINYLNITQNLENTKRDLNVLLGRDVEEIFEVDTTVTYAEGLTFEVLMENAMDNNVTVLQNEGFIRSSEYDIVVSKSGYLPQINLNAGYNWDQRDNGPVSFFQKQKSNGLATGLSLSWNLFDGGFTRTRLQNSKIALDNQRIIQTQQEQNIQRDVSNAWGIYQNSLFVLSAETKNLVTNQRNFERTQEQYKLGQITSIVFREAQQNLLLSQLNYNRAKYDAKVAELALLQLSGGLLEAEL